MGVLARAPRYVTTSTWSPLDLTGLALWLDSSDAASFTYSSGVLVSQWNDKSGNARHFTQGTTANQPSRNGTKNGLDTVVFANARTDNMTGTVFSPSTATFAIAGVAAPTASSARVYFSLGSNSHAAVTHRSGNLNRYGGLLGAVAWVEASGVGDTSGYSVGLLRRSSGANTLRRNAVDLTVSLGGASTPVAATGSMWLGGDSVTKVDVDIAEIIVTDGSSITGSDLTSLESYLNAKWAVY